MQKSILRLEAAGNSGSQNTYRTIIKTKHGRVLFLSLEVCGDDCDIKDCFYIDRRHRKSSSSRYSSKPKKLQTLQFPKDKLLSVIASELDKQFYGVEFIQNNQANLPMDDYIRAWSQQANRNYRFLIMVGDGSTCNGLPGRLRTRLKNKLHRSVYVDLEYYKDGQGVVKQCCYYDRTYKRLGIQVTPPMLISCFFPYTCEGILNLLNDEICCDFTHMIITDGIDLDSNTTPLCGAL